VRVVLDTEATVRRRYEKSLASFFNLYRPIAESWLMLDNSRQPEPRPIAWRNPGGPLQIVRGGPWPAPSGHGRFPP
jgi:hypothetical protein